MSRRSVPFAEMSVNQHRPTVRDAIPATSSGLAPTRPTKREAIVDPTTMHSVIGRKARPARIGE